MPVIYHERQVSALCGQHCLNNLLQGPYFTEIDLAEIAQELDRKELALMMENGVDDETRKFMAAGSQNVADDGNFSVQVLSEALRRSHGLTLEDTRRPESRAVVTKPHFENGFVLNRHSHWYTVVKIGWQWWQINSTQGLPEQLTESHLSATLAQLIADKWTVFVVRGDMPKPMLPSSGAGLASNWVDPAKPPADRLDNGSGFGGGAPFRGGAEQQKKSSYVAFSGAGQTLGGSSAPSSGGGAAAMADGMSEEAQLALAIAMSGDLATKERLERRLPEEPADGTPAARVAIRMPDGVRASRKFPAEASLQALIDFVVVQLAGSPSTTQGTGRWQLSSQYPPMKIAFSSHTATIEDAEKETLTFTTAGLAPSAQLHLAAA